MRKNKKAISPLIATVLLIGTTIALAALVMVWGQRLFEDVTERTQETANIQIACTSNIQFTVFKACTSGSAVTIIVDNKNDMALEDFIARVHGISGDEISVNQSITAGTPLTGFARKTYNVTYSLSSGVDGVELIPKIKIIDTNTIGVCSERSEKFSLDGQVLDTCPP